jgi:hypothetical protein
MKCIDCGKDSNKKDRLAGGGRCPGCGHPFVTDPQEDGFTDMAIKSAVDAVSSNGTLYFSKDHLSYQLQRKLTKKINAYRIGFWVSIVALVVFIILFAIIGHGIFIILSIISTVSLIVTSVSKFKLNTSISSLPILVDKWLSVNPNDKLLTPQKAQTDLTSASSANLDDISFDKVLICERDDMVDFFLSNLFHFHYSCPVLGGNGYPKGIFEDMLSRLKQNPNLKVFILHDYSPAGAVFARRVKTDAKWFGDKPYDIVDLGLNAGQNKLFKNMTHKFIDRNEKTKETAEVALFAPAVLIGLCGAAIVEGVPFDLITINNAAAASSSSGYG